jgi:hypothetical protein
MSTLHFSTDFLAPTLLPSKRANHYVHIEDRLNSTIIHNDRGIMVFSYIVYEITSENKQIIIPALPKMSDS